MMAAVHRYRKLSLRTGAYGPTRGRASGAASARAGGVYAGGGSGTDAGAVGRSLRARGQVLGEEGERDPPGSRGGLRLVEHRRLAVVEGVPGLLLDVHEDVGRPAAPAPPRRPGHAGCTGRCRRRPAGAASRSVPSARPPRARPSRRTTARRPARSAWPACRRSSRPGRTRASPTRRSPRAARAGGPGRARSRPLPAGSRSRWPARSRRPAPPRGLAASRPEPPEQVRRGHHVAVRRARSATFLMYGPTPKISWMSRMPGPRPASGEPDVDVEGAVMCRDFVDTSAHAVKHGERGPGRAAASLARRAGRRSPVAEGAKGAIHPWNYQNGAKTPLKE